MANKYLNYDGLIYLWSKIKNTFVAKETGKGLSTNDYTTAEKTKLSGIEANANNYSLPTASASTLGGIKVGSNLTITDGVLSADAQAYTLPTASASVKGGIKIGDNLTVNGETLSAQPGAYILQMTGSNTSGTIPAFYGTAPTKAELLAAYNAKREIAVELYDDSESGSVFFRCEGIENYGNGVYYFSFISDGGMQNSLAAPRFSRFMIGADNSGAAAQAISTFSLIFSSAKGAASGVCPLNSSSKIDSTYLPSYVDDVVEGYYDSTTGKFYSDSAKTQEITGETGKIYVDLSTNLSYRYGGSAYVVITSSDMTALTNSEIDAAIAAA